MANQNIVLPGELQSADIEERKLAKFYLAEAQRLARMGGWVWQVEGCGRRIRGQEAELQQMLDFTAQYLCVLGGDGTPICSNRASLD